MNILINDKGEASLIDFGVARILQTSGFTTKTSQATWRYFAPEMMNSDDDIIQRVTTETDVYAFSMTVIEVCIYASIAEAEARLRLPVDFDRSGAILPHTK